MPKQYRSVWDTPVTGPKAEEELALIRSELEAMRAGGSDDYGDHADTVAWLLDYVAELKGNESATT